MSAPVLITPRRNFLVRALGFTAAGAAMAVPVLAVETPEQRLAHHLDGAAKAMAELFPGCAVGVRRDWIEPAHIDRARLGLATGDREQISVAINARSPTWSYEKRLARMAGVSEEQARIVLARLREESRP